MLDKIRHRLNSSNRLFKLQRETGCPDNFSAVWMIINSPLLLIVALLYIFTNKCIFMILNTILSVCLILCVVYCHRVKNS